MALYSCTSFGMLFRCGFLYTIFNFASFYFLFDCNYNRNFLYSSFISNVVRTFLSTSFALGFTSIAFLILVVTKLLLNPLLIPYYNLKKQHWNFCNKFPPWCDMFNSLELQGCTLGLQSYVIFALVLLLPKFWWKTTNMNCNQKFVNGFTWFLIQWYPKLSSLF